jgi:hypothetical protein
MHVQEESPAKCHKRFQRQQQGQKEIGRQLLEHKRKKRERAARKQQMKKQGAAGTKASHAAISPQERENIPQRNKRLTVGRDAAGPFSPIRAAGCVPVLCRIDCQYIK